MSAVIAQRPRRWDEPYSHNMSDAVIDAVLASPRFADIPAGDFPKSLTLRDILRNDCRVRKFNKHELIVHAGAYINSAFLILSGSATLVLAPGIDPSAWGQKKTEKQSVFTALQKWMSKSDFPEVRLTPGVTASEVHEQDVAQAVPRIENLFDYTQASGADTLTLTHGDVFGESAVLGRTEMTNTVVSNTDCDILEVRWQGLREICKYDADFKQSIETVYRERGLVEHLLSVPLFKHVEKEKIYDLAKHALFEVHGEFDWQRSFQTATKQAKTDDDYNRIIESEPIISKEGDYPDGLLLVRNGFARVSRYINHGHYTMGHLAAGGLYGLQELYDSWLSTEALPLRSSLRALGYTDVIRIPTYWLEQNVFEVYPTENIEEELGQYLTSSVDEGASAQKHPSLIDRKFTEFLVENRLINGTETMMIDLERCVRCDDCVTACANAHDNNPRFVRHGPTFGRYMIANACMHCDDPVCMIGCPTGAIHRSETGVVTINDTTCIGCSTCANSCPYDNIRMVPIRDKAGNLYKDEKSVPIVKATKCDLCSQVPGGPACERACAHDALIRIDVKDTARLSEWINR